MVTVRVAVEDDMPAIEAALPAAFEALADAGSEILPTERTLAFFAALLRRYLGGAGAVVLAVEGDVVVGLTFGGQTDFPFDVRFAAPAVGWATYVAPPYRRHRLATRMREVLKKELSTMGFRTLIGSTPSGSRSAVESAMKVGFAPFSINGFTALGSADEHLHRAAG